jgi:anti-sigma factor RsiW
MMTETSTFSDTDLEAYVDDQLDAVGRARVEALLSKNPALAARVMADLSIVSSLRASSVADDPQCGPRTREAARRLQSGLSEVRFFSSLRKVAAVGLLIAIGWFANPSIGTRDVNANSHPPPFVEQAVRAHNTSLLRAQMDSQPDVKAYDRAEIRSATAIVMPQLPNDWKVVDVQVFPSELGPTVEALVLTGEETLISLFAGRPGTFAVEPVTDLNLSGAEAAWWQIGDVAYAVVSSTPEMGLLDEAEALKNSLY